MKQICQKRGFTLAERIFAQRLCEQPQETLKKVFCGICLRFQHDNAYKQTKRFKALDGIMAVLKERSKFLVNNSRPAFTLAETLIALTIIGVIAAITVPVLMQNTQKQEIVSKLKRTYSTFSQAANLIISNEGNPKSSDGGWASSSMNIYDLYLKYLNNAKECSSAEGCWKQQVKYINGSKWPENFGSSSRPSLVLADGTQVHFLMNGPSCTVQSFGSNPYCAEIIFDLNAEKAPNTVGRDVFMFVITETGLQPAGCRDTEYADCKSGWGFGCTCKVLREGAMNY